VQTNSLEQTSSIEIVQSFCMSIITKAVVSLLSFLSHGNGYGNELMKAMVFAPSDGGR
jgi:hypothetical protein